MKRIYLVILAVFTCYLGSCKKDKDNMNTGQITGKWHEDKMEIHESSGTAVDRDTTFTASSFTKDDYFEFTSDLKAVFSQSGDYNFIGKSESISGGTIGLSVTHYTYSVIGGQLKLVSTDFYPSNLIDAANRYELDDIVQIDATHLVLHTNYTGPAPFSLTTTMYFTKTR